MDVETDVIKGLQNQQVIIISARCKINYKGRVEAELGMGDRIILIKKDKTLLVHQPEGNNPINYMKKGTNHSFKKTGSVHFLTSINRESKEYLDIYIEKVYFHNIQDLQDGRKQTLAGNEKDMSDWLYQNPEIIEAGFTPLNREEHTKYGFIDVFGHDKNGVLTIVECKRYKADLSAVTQLRRYVEKMKKTKGVNRIRGIIAAPDITANALTMLTDWGFTLLRVEPPKRLMQTKDQTKLNKFV